MDVTRALLELAPGAEFMCVDDNYNQITWLSPNIPKPTKAQVDAKIEELKAAQPMKLLRVERDRLIAETDWWVLPDRTPTDEQLAYRRALRDLPANTTDPTNPVWPTKPA